MIIKTYPKNLYGKYFLAVEAPDDEQVAEGQPKPRRNVKVISVKPSNRGKDFTQVGSVDDSDTGNNTNADNDTDVDSTTKDVPEASVEQDTIQPQTGAEQPEANDADDTNAPDTDDDNTDFVNTDGIQDENQQPSETEDDGPDTGGDEDFVAQDDTTQPSDTDDTGNTNDQSDGNNTSSADNKLNPGVELDSTRKYNLYKEYMSLYNACDNYIGKLENILRDNSDENQIIKISVSNLREVKDILFDYMTIRFQLNTYVQSLLFYQKMVVAVQLVFNLLKSIKITKQK